jgi:hypothetical protein
LIAPAKSNTEDDSPVQFGGMVDNDEDDEAERSILVNDKGSKKGSKQLCAYLFDPCEQQRALKLTLVIIPEDRSGVVHPSHAM